MLATLRSIAQAWLATSLLLAPASAATFVVDSSADDSDADLSDPACDIGTGACTLRAAIEQANELAGADHIEFALSAQAPIVSAGQLRIADDLTVDGTTQPGAAPNSLALGTDAVIGVVVDCAGTDRLGFVVEWTNVVLRGLAVRGFQTCVRIDNVLTTAGTLVLVGVTVPEPQAALLLVLPGAFGFVLWRTRRRRERQ